MRSIFTLLLVVFSVSIFAQATGDTIVIPTFNYTQTDGGGIRDTMIDFPDNPDQTYEKIIMLYNMRCKDANVSVPGNTNYGCGEWDYSCNTYINDSSRTDSVINFLASHSISAFNGSSFNYVESPIFDYYQYRQKVVEINNTVSEDLFAVGSGNLALTNAVATDNKSGRSQYLYTQSEMAAAGLTAGNIDALLLDVVSGTADAGFLEVNIKHSTKTELNTNEPDELGFRKVFFNDYSFTPGLNRIQFHTPFGWNGTSNIIIEFIFTNNIPDNQLEIQGESTSIVSGIYSKNGFNLNAVNGKIDIPTTAFSSISDQISVSFWSYGNEDIQPISNSIFQGVDTDNKRQLNVHLPWGNGGIYFDCGNDGSGFDRIEKSATPEEYKGNWSYWTFTKNATSGDMKIYLNGDLWQSGTDKNKLIDIQEFVLATSGNADRSYYGNIDDFRVWNTELSEEVIQNWMYKDVDETHPDYSNLVAYYKFDEGSGDMVSDASVNAESANITDFLYWEYQRGNDLKRGFKESMNKPNITLAQGEYDLTVTDLIVTDSVKITPNIVREYEIITRFGGFQNDSINEVSVSELWEARYQRIYDPSGNLIDSIMTVADGTIEIVDLQYYTRYPSKYEIMSFVTPYGIYLDLGENGKTWAFDVTDYSPILKGKKRMTMERGGQRQEDMNIKFLYILGTPPHDVVDINQIWRADSRGYVSIIDNKSFEEREFHFDENASSFKIRSVITGHGQQGEFTGRFHNININGGEKEFEWKVWNECADNPIYPQGGTWIYDRAGWCPGAPSILNEFDITEFVTPGQTHTVDYGLLSASGASNYIVNNQLVSYGAPNFALDAAIVRIIKPNNEDASQERFNPACTSPEVIIKNTGSTTLTSLDIEYSIEGGIAENYQWTGSLDFLETDTLVLPVNELSFWIGTINKFNVNISNPNQQEDEYAFNNSQSTLFDDIHVYPENELITIQLKTNNYGYQSSYTLFNDDGSEYYTRDNCEDNTTYEDDYFLTHGCYKLQINDSGDNGLEFWAQPAQGEGSFKILNSDGQSLFTFDPDFGKFAIFEFGIGNITNVNGKESQFVINVFPNPATDKINLKIEGADNTNISVSLVNSVMAKVIEKNWTINETGFNEEINLKDLPSGIYFLQINFGDYTKTKKIVKY
jgi:hypothetical protein